MGWPWAAWGSAASSRHPARRGKASRTAAAAAQGNGRIGPRPWESDLSLVAQPSVQARVKAPVGWKPADLCGSRHVDRERLGLHVVRGDLALAGLGEEQRLRLGAVLDGQVLGARAAGAEGEGVRRDVLVAQDEPVPEREVELHLVQLAQEVSRPVRDGDGAAGGLDGGHVELELAAPVVVVAEALAADLGVDADVVDAGDVEPDGAVEGGGQVVVLLLHELRAPAVGAR